MAHRHRPRNEKTNRSAPRSGEGRPPELMAPAGDSEAAYAAFAWGADSVYVGMRSFSARADAANFSLEDLDDLVAYARTLDRPARVYVALNTLVLDGELAAFVELLDGVYQTGADAVILQDLGACRIACERVPDLPRHASTQMAVHNREGVEQLAKLGFSRVVLARELGLDEIRECAMVPGIETECFVHGALCYSYSGLCLHSSHLLGRSGNRGTCAQVCRNSFVVHRAGLRSRAGLPFSMTDLSLADHVDELRDAGVHSLKIEGRLKSATYVAAACRLYRGVIDRTLSGPELTRAKADLQTVFSRRSTSLYLVGDERAGKADPDVSGHRGAPVGSVEAVILRVGSGGAHLRFRTARRLELRDGLQLDLPGLYKPFGFSIQGMRVIGEGRRGKASNATVAPPGSIVEVELPDEHPQIPRGTIVHCSSSQQVKQALRVTRPPAGRRNVRATLDVSVMLAPDGVTVRASARGRSNMDVVSLERAFDEELSAARNRSRTNEAIRLAFGKLGDTPFALGDIIVDDPHGLFAPASMLNIIRREVTAELERLLDAARVARVDAAARAASTEAIGAADGSPRWSIRVDRLEYLDGFTDAELGDLDEVVVDVAGGAFDRLESGLRVLGDRIGRDHIRCVLPTITRGRERDDLLWRIGRLHDGGYTKWEASNISAWGFLGPGRGDDLSTGWSVFVTNRQAAMQAIDMGASMVTLSVEDGLDNMRRLARAVGERAAAVVYQDTPLFISETCPHATLDDGCGQSRSCARREAELISEYGQKSIAVTSGCRTTVIGLEPYSIAHRLDELVGVAMFRAEFRIRQYQPDDVRRRFAAIRAGQRLERTHEGNAMRGLR